MTAKVKLWDALPGYELNEEIDLPEMHSWFLDATHCVPPWTPMFSWFWNRYCSHGLKYCADLLSIPTCKGWEFKGKNGGGYCAFHIVRDEEEIRRREVKFREALRPWIEDFAGIWNRYKKEMLEIYEPIKAMDIDNASNCELLYHLYDLISMYRRMWEIHFQGMYVAYNAWLTLEDLFKKRFGIGDQSPEFQKLLIGFDNKVFQVDKQLWQLGRLAVEKGLGDIFETNEARDIIPKLEQIEAGSEWLKEVRNFLLVNGWRMQRMAEINEPTWIEDPTPPISAIKGFIARGGDFVLDEVRERLERERERAVASLLQKVPAEEKEWFAALIRLAQKASSYTEEHDHYLDMYSHALIRRGLLGIGRRLVHARTIGKPDDIFYLNPEEVESVMLVPEAHKLQYIVDRRRAEWEEWQKMPNPPVITDRSSLEEAIEKDLLPARDAIAMKTSIGEMPKVRPELKADLYGITASPGVAQGPARVILNYEQLGDVQEGDILIAPATAPTWTPVFGLIKGVVIDRGGILCHAAIVGREYGLPTVVNTFEGTTKIKTGQWIKVDADEGAVYIRSA
ncbi:PEP-utilizing enzyme [Dehalococcoidia bacterium]|nr:PEP-utilizing enzyme [Dehalococcoidia bacterium]